MALNTEQALTQYVRDIAAALETKEIESGEESVGIKDGAGTIAAGHAIVRRGPDRSVISGQFQLGDETTATVVRFTGDSVESRTIIKTPAASSKDASGKVTVAPESRQLVGDFTSQGTIDQLTGRAGQALLGRPAPRRGLRRS